MYLKLALRNVRKSLGDYAIYFITLFAGVAVFYAFNSIEAQQILFDIQQDDDVFKSVSEFMGLFSYVVAFVLGFLVIYANGFIVRRRHREFGTYLTLGMSTRGVTLVMLIETLLIGLVALVLGIAAGFLLSQLLSFATAKLLGTIIQHYQFVFSMGALKNTVLCLGIIFAVVALFNVVIIGRTSIIKLLDNASRQQRVIMRNPIASAIVFVASIAILAFAYNRLAENGLLMLDDPKFMQATIAMLIGTLLLFWSAAGIVIAIVSKLKAYHRGLTAFTMRQVASRINTAFVSLWAISVILFFAMTVFSTGMGIADALTSNAEKLTPYDCSAPLFQSIDQTLEEEGGDALAAYQSNEGDRVAAIRLADPDWDTYVREAVQLDSYLLISKSGEGAAYTYDDLLSNSNVPMSEALASITNNETPVTMQKLSQYNATMRMIGQTGLTLGHDEVAIANTIDFAQAQADDLVSNHAHVSYGGYELTVACGTSVEESNTAMGSVGLVIIANDDIVDELAANDQALYSSSYLNFMFVTNDADANDQALSRTSQRCKDAYSESWPLEATLTQQEMLSQALFLRMLVTYLAVYIGFVFLIAVTALLAIRQLSDVSVSLPRYRTLSRIGTDEHDIQRSLRHQVELYFLAPLVVAICHTAWSINVMNGSLTAALGVNPANSIALTTVLMTIIYGGYMLITYLVSKRLVKATLAR